jgi:hypothetical protein
MEFKELYDFDEKEVEIAGRKFKFVVWSDSGGEWSGFKEIKEDPEQIGIFIYATLNYEGRGIPVDVEINPEEEHKNCEHYLGEVKDFEQYVKIVKLLSEKYIIAQDLGGKIV